jgi:hypothetical protein
MTLKQRSAALYIALAAAAILASLFIAKDVDFRVYWLGVTGYFNGTRPAYGPQSGLGFPMEYRYPPVTYLLLWPLKLVPLRVDGFLWMLAIWANATWTMGLALRVRGLRFDKASIVAVLGFLCAYLFLAVRYGNVQPFVIAWIFAALMVAERKPMLSGLLMALAVTFKIWPFLFAPLFLRRGRRTAAAWSAGLLAALWIAPVLIIGPGLYGQLLHDWYQAVGRVGTTYSEFYYFPGMSIRGLALRWLTPVAPPLDYFPRINVLSLNPVTVVHLWLVLAALLYACFVLWMLRSDRQTMWVWDGAAFVIYSMIEPYAVKSGLISLAPAAITAGCLFALRRVEIKQQGRSWRKWANAIFLASCGISLAQALLQYKPWQRYLLSYGVDFWGECLLLAAFAIWIGRTRVPYALALAESGQTADGRQHASGILGLAAKREELPGLTGAAKLTIKDAG